MLFTVSNLLLVASTITLLSPLALAAPAAAPVKTPSARDAHLDIVWDVFTETVWTTLDVITTVYDNGVPVSTSAVVSTTTTTPAVVVATTSSVPVAPSTLSTSATSVVSSSSAAVALPSSSSSSSSAAAEFFTTSTSTSPAAEPVATTMATSTLTSSSSSAAAIIADVASTPSSSSAASPSPSPSASSSASGTQALTASTTADCEGTGDACVGDVTHWDGGLGACGTVVDTSSQLGIALPYEFMGTLSNTNPYCGRSVTLYNPTSGTTVQATVVDKCMGCVDRAIDCTDILFDQITDGTGDGRVHGIEWWLN